MTTSTARAQHTDRVWSRWWFRALVAVVVLVAIFGFGIPRLADYGEAWEVVASMRASAIVLIAAAGIWNLYSYWPVLIAALPGLRLREAIVVNQASTAVANSVPGGGAIAMAVTFKMLQAWGFSTAAISNQIVATGVANLIAKLAMPIGALALVAAAGEASGALLWLALLGVAFALALLVSGALILRARHTTERAGDALDRLVARFRRGRGRQDHRAVVAPWLVELRDRLQVLARRSGLRLLALTLISHVSLFVVLLVTLRAVGVEAADVSWQRAFAVFAFVRLLSALPITPGGTGVVELGYVGLLTAEAPSGMGPAIAAATLVFRAVTFVLPLLFGAVAWLVFQANTSWHEAPDTRGQIDDG